MVSPLLRLAAACAAGALAATAAASPAQDYMLYCMGCHGMQAQGVPGRVPPLAGSVSLFMRTAEGRNYVLRVPGAANSALPDAQLADLRGPFRGCVRRTPLADVQGTRREVVRSLAASGAAPATQY